MAKKMSNLARKKLRELIIAGDRIICLLGLTLAIKEWKDKTKKSLISWSDVASFLQDESLSLPRGTELYLFLLEEIRANTPIYKEKEITIESLVSDLQVILKVLKNEQERLAKEFSSL